MANKRELKLREYGISKKRYKELCGFCEQYPEWIEELKYKKDTMKSRIITDMPMGLNIGKATEDLAIRREELKKKCELIEQTAIQADAELYQYIIQSVCYEMPFHYLKIGLKIPINQTDFYVARRKFFCLLDKNKKK